MEEELNVTETNGEVVEENAEATVEVIEENADTAACSNEKLAELAAAIDGHFLAVRNLLKFNKDKDANLAKLNAELQRYRDGIGSKETKTIALSVIGLRENSKKSIRDFGARGLNAAEAKKYLEYLVYDYEDLLSELNISVDGGVRYNGKSVADGFDGAIKKCETGDFELSPPPALDGNDFDSIVAYLKAAEEYIALVLKDNARLDGLMRVCIENESLYERGVHQVVLYPIINEIAALYAKVKSGAEEAIASLSDENATESFVKSASSLVEGLDEILDACSVEIDPFVSDDYDPKRHRLLKIVPTDDESQNGKIATRYTDCYAFEDHVIYPQKADVIKFQKK